MTATHRVHNKQSTSHWPTVDLADSCFTVDPTVILTQPLHLDRRECERYTTTVSADCCHRLTPRIKEASRTNSKSLSESNIWKTNWMRAGSLRNDCSSYILTVTRVLLMILIHRGNRRSLFKTQTHTHNACNAMLNATPTQYCISLRRKAKQH